MNTKPLPPMGEDPSIVRGQQLRAGFTQQAQSIRQNRSLGNADVAREVVALWERTNKELVSLFDDLQSRRHARLEALSDLVPLGPAVPAGASPADVAVIQQAFRVALGQARDAMVVRPTDSSSAPLQPNKNTLDAMLADAEKFDDDTLRRAVLTAAHEAGHMSLIRSWTDLMGVTKELEEFGELQAAVAGQGIAGSWNFTTFRPVPEPPEVKELDRLKAQEEAAVQHRIRGSVTGVRF